MGFTRFKGNIYPGRHDPLVDGDVFGRVQEVISIRATGERERTHHHYLKSTLYCGNCHTGEDAYGRIIIAHVNGRGGTYDYFFCRRSQEKLCDAPYMQMARVEDAVARYWGRLEVSAAFIEAARVGVRRAVEKGQATARSLHTQLTENFRKLDQQEENLLDLAADGTLPREVVQKRMNAILRNRAAMNTRLEKTEQKLAAVVDYLDAALSLLERPGELYANATDEQRRMLNQAVFSRIYVYADDVTDVEFNEPFDILMAAGELFENPMKTAPEDRGGDVSAQAANL